MTHPALAGLQAVLDADPLDITARLVLADLYEDMGDEEAAACMRWMAREGARPLYPGSYSLQNRWGWTHRMLLLQRAAQFKHPENYRRAALPARLWYALGGEKHYAWKYFPTRQDAEDALLAAWRALPPSERPAV